MASYIQDCWFSGAPAVATMGAKARQNDANASAVLIFMAPDRALRLSGLDEWEMKKVRESSF
jgi:hypothetical protein